MPGGRSVPTRLEDLVGGVLLASPADGQPLTYDGVSGLWKNRQAAAGVVERAPYQLAFGPPTPLPYFDPAPVGLTDFLDTFGSTATFTQSTTGAGSVTAFTASGNVGTLTTSGVITAIESETSHSLSAPQVFCSLRALSHPAVGTSYSTIGVGIAKDALNYVIAIYDSISSHLWIQQSVAGTLFNAATVTKTLTPPFNLGLSLVGNSAVAWYDTGSGWTYGLTYNVKGNYNFETSGNMAGYKGALEVSSGGATTTWTFSTLRAGRFGGVGMRDLVVVSNPDGSPYLTGNAIYFTASAADPAGWAPATPQYGGTYLGVFSLDLVTLALAQTGALFVSRGGFVTNDHAGHIIAYPNGDRRVLVSTWGSGGFGSGSNAQVFHQLVASGSQADVLTAPLSVLSGMAALSLPLGGGTVAYDPYLVYDSANTRWLLAYTIATSAGAFYPALASSPDLVTWSLIGADSALPYKWEGTRLVNLAGQWWVLAGGPAGSGVSSVAAGNASRVYDVTMAFKGPVPGVTFAGLGSDNAGTNPHPMVFVHPDGKTILLLTFDGTKFAPSGNVYTWGQPNVQRSPRYF